MLLCSSAPDGTNHARAAAAASSNGVTACIRRPPSQEQKRDPRARASGKVQVTRLSRQVFMTKQNLERLQLNAGFQLMARIAMPQPVRCHMLT